MKTLLKCVYCQGSIDTEEPEWGYYLESAPHYWHIECLEIFEGIVA